MRSFTKKILSKRLTNQNSWSILHLDELWTTSTDEPHGHAAPGVARYRPEPNSSSQSILTLGHCCADRHAFRCNSQSESIFRLGPAVFNPSSSPQHQGRTTTAPFGFQKPLPENLYFSLPFSTFLYPIALSYTLLSTVAGNAVRCCERAGRSRCVWPYPPATSS